MFVISCQLLINSEQLVIISFEKIEFRMSIQMKKSQKPKAKAKSKN